MQKIPVFSIVGYSGSGKTTFLEKLLSELKKRNIRAAVLKHDAHEFEIDKPGKDSWRLTKAGALVTGLISEKRAVLMENRPVLPEMVVDQIRDVDVILTEGFKTEKWQKIMLHRQETGKSLPLKLEECLTVVSDVKIEGVERTKAGRQYELEDAAGVAELILEEIREMEGKADKLPDGKISLERAGELVAAQGKTLEAEKVSVFEAAGRVLAEDIYAAMSQPPFARSAMDGYAVKSEDIKGTGRETPVRLKLIDSIYAGMEAEMPVGTGETVRIMTGAMVPAGADCIIRQEDCTAGQEIEIYKAGFPGENICPAGEDFQKGELLATKGRKTDAYLAAAVAAAGVKELLVYRKARVALITTGDELKQPGEQLKPGEIYDSNQVYLSTRLREMGCEIILVCGAVDKMENICAAIKRAVKEADLILTTGGVSVGERDLLPAVMEELKAELLFHGISIKPGMPTMFSLTEGVPVLSLSGNPYSAAAMFELLVPPFLKRLQGGKETGLTIRTAELANDFLKKSPVRRIVRGCYDGKQVYVSEKQGNGQLQGGIGCNCLLDIPAGSESLKAGDIVKIFTQD